LGSEEPLNFGFVKRILGRGNRKTDGAGGARLRKNKLTDHYTITTEGSRRKKKRALAGSFCIHGSKNSERPAPVREGTILKWEERESIGSSLAKRGKSLPPSVPARGEGRGEKWRRGRSGLGGPLFCLASEEKESGSDRISPPVDREEDRKRERGKGVGTETPLLVAYEHHPSQKPTQRGGQAPYKGNKNRAPITSDQEGSEEREWGNAREKKCPFLLPEGERPN